MTIRISFSTWLVYAALFLGALYIIVPSISHAAEVGSDGSTCATVFEGLCIGFDGKPHGTPFGNPDITAETTRVTGCDTRATGIPTSVAKFAATASTYVPVYDDAVTQNTGYLVYKACALDAVASELKQLSTAKITADTIKYINTGDNGNPYFVQNIAQDRAMVVNRNTNEFYKSGTTDAISSVFRQDVVDASKQQYLSQISGQSPSYKGDFGDDTKQRSFLDGKFLEGGGFSSLWKMATNPANSPLFAFVNFNAARDASNAQVAADRTEQLAWGQGSVAPECTAPSETNNPDEPTIYNICTPGFLISQILSQVVTSGFRQQEGATNLDALINGTFTGLSGRVLSDSNGLIGISQPIPNTSGSGSTGGGTSYLDQMFQAILDLIQKIPSKNPTPTGSSAFEKLSTALSAEQEYLSYRQQVQTYFGTQSEKFTTTQNMCWVSLASAVSLIATSTPYTVATSTTYATIATNDIIAPLSSIFRQDIDHSTTTIAVLQTLIASVASSTSSSTADAAALAQLAALTSNKTLHTPAEITSAKQNVTDIQSSIGVKVDATIATWKQGTGWCNASSTSVVQSWLNAWKN